jgi:hypothetical protein
MEPLKELVGIFHLVVVGTIKLDDLIQKFDNLCDMQ